MALEFVDGTPRLAVEVDGSGPPVVFLHGIGGNRQIWAQQMKALRSSFTVLSWDARGYGASGDVAGPRRFGHFSDDLVRLCDHFDVERAHIVGLSMGARIAMDFAPDHLDRVATLVLCDCFYAFDGALTPEKQNEFVALREKPLREGKTFADLAPALIDSLVGPGATPQTRQELRHSLEALRTDSYLKTLRSSLTFDRGDDLPQIDAPVQLIFGAEDRLTPPSIGQDMLGLLPNAKLVVIEGAGHLSNLEAPGEFNAILTTFLAEHRTRAGFHSSR